MVNDWSIIPNLPQMADGKVYVIECWHLTPWWWPIPLGGSEMRLWSETAAQATCDAWNRREKAMHDDARFAKRWMRRRYVWRTITSD